MSLVENRARRQHRAIDLFMILRVLRVAATASPILLERPVSLSNTSRRSLDFWRMESIAYCVRSSPDMSPSVLRSRSHKLKMRRSRSSFSRPMKKSFCAAASS